MDQQNPTLAKIPIMDTGKFEQWQFRIQQYLQHEHYALWEVIEFGDSYEVPASTASTTTTDITSRRTGKKSGRTVTLTAEDMQKKKNDVKARTILLLSLPDEHQLRFSKYKTAKELWATILKTFGDNEATKKTKKNILKQQYGNFKAEGSETLEQMFNRLQVIVGQPQFMDVEVEQDDLNQKFFTSLAPEWLMHTIVWRNRSDLDTMSLDDLYNHLKVYESEVQKKSKPNSKNMAFISSAKHSRGNEDVNTASTNVLTASANIRVASISQDSACAYIASQSSGSQIKFKDINQIDEDDMEEMDIKWNMALLSMRADKFWKKTGKKISIQGSDVAGFDKSKVECFNCHKMGHFARECRAPRSQDRGRRDNYKQGSYMANDEEDHALVADEEDPTEFSLMANTSAKSKELETLKKEKEGVDGKLAGFLTASKDLDNLNENQRLDKNKEGLGYSVVPPPPAQIYSSFKKDLSWTGLLKFADDTVTDYSRPSPTIESTSGDDQNINPSVPETDASPNTITPKPFLKFVKPNDSPSKSKTCKTKTPKKPPVEYAELYRKPNKKLNVRGNQRNWNNLKSHQLGGCKITGKGTIKIGKLKFENVYFVKDLKDFKLLYDANILLRTPRQHNMYSIDLNNIVPHKDLTCLVAKASTDECMLWHRRLGKQHKASCKSKLVNSVTKPLHTLHMDLFGPTSDLKMKIIRCDNGGEFRNKEMNDFCSQKWIKREFSNARTPQQNGVVEKGNRTLIEAARTMFADAKLPVTFWAEAINTACYVQNRVLVNKSHNKTPYELFNGRSHAIGFLKPFGCHVMILNTLDNLGKFKEKGDEGTKDATSQEVKKNVSSLRYIALPNWAHDALLESSSSKPQDHCSTEVPESSGNTNPTASTSNPPANQMETNSGISHSYYESNGVEADVSNMKTTITASPTSTLRIHKDHPKVKPKNIFDALQDPSWVEAMQEELLQFKIQNVWTLVDCPKGLRPMGTKWVLKNKKNEKRIVIRNKAKLVAQGHTQEEGIDYDEVFRPIARTEAIKLLLAYASFMRFTVYKMDVKSAFLYGIIDEEVYVMQPPGF
nr:retrovirus-related Pol polyprotein from transposon TNT 1-94 [Tanacetum cinerariifolium]